jgi:hypothetical protein
MQKFLSLLGLIVSTLALSQNATETPEVKYEQLYDEPYTVNKLFIGFQPFYGELFATNVNAGFGIDAHYFLRQQANFRVQFRKAYASRFFDLHHENAKKNSSVENEPLSFNYVELGMTWHVKDFDTQSKTKLVLYKKTYQGAKWAAQVPLRIEVPCRVRKIFGARLGGIAWQSTIDFSNALQQDGKTNLDFGNGDFDESINIFSNIRSAGIYAGGSMTWIKNIAVGFDEYEGQIDDGIITLFADILYSPYLKIDDVEYIVRDEVSNTSELRTYSPEILKLNSFGFRVGLDGKFNRKLSWGYGGEVGYRPTIVNLGFFAAVKISIPLYGTNLDNKVRAVNKEGN